MFHEIIGNNDLYNDIRKNVKGIAVKLSTLSNNEISLKEVLLHWGSTIIIDAEYDRLDHWVKESLENGELSKSDLARIIVTVQIRREDAFDQLKYFHILGIKVVLVAGHNSYFNKEIRGYKVAKEMTEVNESFDNIIFLGIGYHMKKKIEFLLNQEIIDTKILELLGNQKLNNSALWSYYVGDKLSKEATSYLKRRSNKKQENYFIRSLDQLLYLCRAHSIYLYVDIISKNDYLRKIIEIDYLCKERVPRYVTLAISKKDKRKL